VNWHREVRSHGTSELNLSVFSQEWAGPGDLIAKRPVSQLWEQKLGTDHHTPVRSRSHPQVSFEREREAFSRLIVDVLRNPKYFDKYIAVVNTAIQGSDSNKEKLAKRIYQKFGYRPIYIGKVTRTKRTIELSSPE